jgi:prepilin-type N-terminal cleavage/methylation domain-containing protein
MIETEKDLQPVASPNVPITQGTLGAVDNTSTKSELSKSHRHMEIKPGNQDSQARRLGNGARGKAAFTLIELLMVITIITILAGLLLPAFATAKGKAHSVKCLSTMRQWGLALQIYANDGDDAIPRDGTDNSGQYSVDTGNKTGAGSPNDPFAWFNALPPAMSSKPFSNYWNNVTSNYRKELPFPGGQGKSGTVRGQQRRTTPS